MDRKKPDLRVFPKRRLRAVAVMDVPIDNQHAVKLELVDRQPARGRCC